jgi:DNA-binding beta-propeller fold protein YncE
MRTAAQQSIWMFALIALLSVRFALAQSSRGGCDSAGTHILAVARVPSPPFDAIPSEQGCWIFASLMGGQPRHGRTKPAGIAVLRLRGGRITAVRLFPLSPPNPLGLVLTHDGKLLIVADARYVYFLGTQRLIHDKPNTIVGAIHDRESSAFTATRGSGPVTDAKSRRRNLCRAGALCPLSSYVAVTPDDRVLFVSDEASAQVSVINLQKARQTGFHENAIIGTIPTGWAPVGLAVSSDGRYLYVTSQSARVRGGPATCRGEIPAEPPHAKGTVQVVDVARALSTPTSSVVASVSAGCNPVRVVLSADDRRLYVTLRGDNALLTFDTGKLVHDPERALLSKLPVGAAPVGVATVNQGRQIVVANTDRFGGDGGNDLTVIEASGIGTRSGPKEWTIQTGKGPWELHPEPPGNALLVTDSTSDQVELIGVDRLHPR